MRGIFVALALTAGALIALLWSTNRSPHPDTKPTSVPGHSSANPAQDAASASPSHQSAPVVAPKPRIRAAVSSHVDAATQRQTPKSSPSLPKTLPDTPELNAIFEKAAGPDGRLVYQYLLDLNNSLAACFGSDTIAEGAVEYVLRWRFDANHAAQNDGFEFADGIGQVLDASRQASFRHCVETFVATHNFALPHFPPTLSSESPVTWNVATVFPIGSAGLYDVIRTNGASMHDQ